MENPYRAPPQDHGNIALDGPTAGLFVRAALVGFVVQVTVGIIKEGGDFIVIDRDEVWSWLVKVFVMYVPILIAASMGYHECRLHQRAKARA